LATRTVSASNAPAGRPFRCEPIATETSRVIYVLPFELTWQGHELLDKIRNPTIWDAIRADVKAKGLESVSLEVIKQIADKEIRSQFNLD
jgi:Hypothetical protein (DUF2513)